MATIKPIEDRSVHQIQSGQVIIDICSVVKELVENSLDAGAKSIDIRFKNHGLDSIEVHDNGGGIAPEDYEKIALKHYTSKLSTYDDLNSLRTFGFRGEALSSLCALSKFHIITARAADGPKGKRLDFEVSGKLKSSSIVASQKGTIVVVENLFHNLPVRRRELEKNIKREYGKVLSLLHAYACISIDVRFAASNQMPKGKKVTVFSTNSNPTTKENIANVYGAKTLLGLIPLNLQFEMDPSTKSTQSARNWSTHEDAGSREVKILGHISRPVVGEGRQTPDRQMFFVNSRPCSLPQVAKAFNEVYKSYNITQSPFIFANLNLDTNAYDVNVSPDKRTILLHDQTALLETLKASLLELFESHDQSVPQSQLSVRKLPVYRPSTVIRESADQPEAGSTTITGQVEDEDLIRKNHPASSSSNEDIVCLVSPAVSLMQNFVGRNAENRSGRSSEPKSTTFSKKNQRLPNFQNLGSELLSHGQDTIDISVVSGSPEPSTPETIEIPKAVQDFNAQVASLHAKHMEQDSSLSPPAPVVDDDIPSVKHTPQKSSQSTIQNAFDRMRPKRIPAETATITVGNTTTTSTVGSTPRKRRRIHTPQFGLNATPSPLFGRTLRTFAALGTQAEDEDEDDDYTLEDDVRRQDSNMPILASQTDSFSGGHEPELSPDTDGKNEAVGNPVPLLATENDEAEESDSGNSEYVEEAEKKSPEEARAAHMIASTEELAAGPSHDNLRRAASLLKGPGKKYSTLYLVRSVNTSIPSIYQSFSRLRQNVKRVNPRITSCVESDLETATPSNSTPEERLSLTVSKSDFALMRIIGQFNLGFIIAMRPSSDNKLSSTSSDLFIIDQHASDEKYNFERLTASTILTPQRLVHPHPLILTAIEEETILSNSADLTANGFIVSIDTSGTTPVGQRCKLLSLPMSREVTFTPSDLEELLAIISDHVGQEVPRPSKVRRLLASRACRGSVMVGKTLTLEQMEKVVRHMGSMEKPWSCPHGRPTMRHLFGLGGWSSWEEGNGVMGMGEERKMTDWRLWLTDRGKGR